MGTQQILMIILSVIVVGTAIAVGIQMFDTQLENQTRQALAAELMQQMSMAKAWWRTPLAMGGGGNGKNADGTFREPLNYEIAQYITRGAQDGSGGGQEGSGYYRNLHGQFWLTKIPGAVSGDQRIRISATSDVKDTITARLEFDLSGNFNELLQF